uniref:Uncharacterized protein n=1 Tax=Strongyloides stercoralis TaxID=6248 RepID=A0A0K0DTW7_STRER
MGIHLRGIRNCCSAGAGSGAWDDHFWSKQEAVVLLELDLKDGNSPGMKWRLIETVSEARRFSRNRLGIYFVFYRLSTLCNLLYKIPIYTSSNFIHIKPLVVGNEFMKKKRKTI